MATRLYLLVILVVMYMFGPSATCSAGELGLSLTYLDRIQILDEEQGLNEPSGLALSRGSAGLWTVSDDTKKVFKLRHSGKIKKADSFAVQDKGLEGIASVADSTFVFVIAEGNNKIIKIDTDSHQVSAEKRLDEMAGYDAVEKYFSDSPANKGLEGITWNPDSSTIYVIKESSPGLLMEVSPDLQTIKSHTLLNEDNGFLDNDISSHRLDFSGICYDTKRSGFWIVSDKGRRLFLYDLSGNRVRQSFTLGYSKNGEYREIEKAEGVAVDPAANRLYVVSDAEARLYIFDIRE